MAPNCQVCCWVIMRDRISDAGWLGIEPASRQSRGDLTRHQEDDGGTQNGSNELCKLHAGSAGCRRCSASAYTKTCGKHTQCKQVVSLKVAAANVAAAGIDRVCSCFWLFEGPMERFYYNSWTSIQTSEHRAWRVVHITSCYLPERPACLERRQDDRLVSSNGNIRGMAISEGRHQQAQ